MCRSGLGVGVNSSTACCVKLPWKQMLLKRWTAIEIRWKRKAVSRGSPVKVEIAFALIGPSVSKASGMKACVLVSAWYFSSFRLAAPSAAAPAVVDVDAKYDSASVSVTVTSHVMQRPAFQGICVRPLGRLPSDRSNPAGSLIDGTSARISDRHTRSLSAWRRVDRPELRLQASPCVPSGLTSAPQRHWWCQAPRFGIKISSEINW